MKSFFAFALSLFLLAGCNDSKIGSSGVDSTQPGSGDPGTRNSRREDTPRTRLAAMKSHAVFAALAQTPECESNSKSVRAAFFEADFRFRETLEHIGEVQCDARIRLLVDESSGMMKSVTECQSPHYVAIANTSDYAVDGNTLRIGRLGTIEVDVDGKTLMFTHLRSASGEPTRLSMTEPRSIDESESSAAYSNFCR